MQQKGCELFHDGGHYHIETSPSIWSANQWTGFYMITASAMKELNDISNHFLDLAVYTDIFTLSLLFNLDSDYDHVTQRVKRS